MPYIQTLQKNTIFILIFKFLPTHNSKRTLALFNITKKKFKRKK